MPDTIDDPKLYFETITSMSLLLRECPGCKKMHIFGFYHQIPKEQQKVDRERLTCIITDTCRDCGTEVPSEYKLTTKSPIESAPATTEQPDAGQACPKCNGSGRSNWLPVHVRLMPGRGPLSDEEAERLAEDIAKCSFCGATGRVPSVQLAWKAQGEEWLEARLSLGVGMREWAERVGVLPSEYVAMENGRIAPRPECSPVKALAHKAKQLEADLAGATAELEVFREHHRKPDPIVPDNVDLAS